MRTIFPAEWTPQTRILVAFPHAADWGATLPAAQRAMLEAVRAIARVCPVTVLDNGTGADAGAALSNEITVRPTPLDDSWIRDFGPLTVLRDGQPYLLDFQFNGWGGKFPAERDNRATRDWLSDVPRPLPGYHYREVPIILEGGSVETDGQGTLLTTSTCLLSAGRNDWSSRTEAERHLTPLLGTDRYLWLDHGHLEGDDTDAHIDTLARFTDPTTIAYVRCDDPADKHYAGLRRMEEELRAFRTRDGRPYRLLPLPWPPPVYAADDGRRLPATYANFLICNGTLFLPTYFGGAETDAAAAATLRKHTAYEIVLVDCRPFLEQHGSLHCLTMQIPAT